jgi:putative RNA 2'-phosphotransferase
MNARAVSKRLAYVLRHDPASVGIVLDEGGWVDVDELLTGLAAHGLRLRRDELERVVGSSDKARYVISGGRIRAAHGHSVPVDLGLTATPPPDELWHGTAAGSVEAILATGLRPRSRRLVHLSADQATARAVGSRHGPPVVLRVLAGRLAQDGAVFYRSTSGVWLTAAVPPEYLEVQR